MRQFALIFTCSPYRTSITAQSIAELTHLPSGINHTSTRVLAPGIALEYIISGDEMDAAALLQHTRSDVADHPIDVNLIKPGSDRRKSLLIADMDSTIIKQECIDELADYAGLGIQVAAITNRAMLGEIAFEDALRERVSLIKGLSREALKRVLKTRISLQHGAKTLIKTMRADGAYTALVSGGFTFFANAIQADVGFDEAHANVLSFDNADCLDGRVSAPILGQEAKGLTLKRLIESRGLSRKATLAVGDGANDLAMIRHAGLGVAFRAKPIVAREADAVLSHSDLTALLYLQGYTHTEIVHV
ncbi:MAG: phosphoserine phosphatase SerB [Hyphomicrobiaceae bacterium]